MYEALKGKGMSKARAAKIANSPMASKHGGQKSGSGGNSKQGGTTAQHKAAGRKGGNEPPWVRWRLGGAVSSGRPDGQEYLTERATVLDMTRNRPTPPSLLNPPEWVTELAGFEMFQVQPTEHGWSAWPEGVDENVEFPGGTWRVVLVMPVDLSIVDGTVDPLLLLVALAEGAVKVEDKIEDLVAHCRASGKTWTQIGQALGMTKQSAWERFSGEE